MLTIPRSDGVVDQRPHAEGDYPEECGLERAGDDNDRNQPRT